jgi:ABC-2 type transport system permease protein
VASESLFTETADDMAPGNNEKLFCAMISSLADHESVVGIPAKSFSMSPLVFSAQTVLVVSIVCNIVVPLMLLVIGIVIWARRRKR